MKIHGLIFEPRSSRGHPTVLDIEDHYDYIHADIDSEESVTDLTVVTIQGDHDVHFEGGIYFRSTERLPDEFIRRYESATRRKIAWLEKFSLTRAAVLLSIVVLALVGFRLLLPWVVSMTVAVFPNEWEKKVGANAFSSMETLRWFSDSELSDDYQQVIREEAKRIAESAGLDRDVEIRFKQSRVLGPNALAFPGGPVVVTDDLVELLSEREEVLAVIAHEIAHIELRHSLQRAIGVAGVSALVLMLFGADESIIEELTVIVADSIMFDSGKDFEREADILAIDYLIASGIDPEALVNVMERLTDFMCSKFTGQAKLDCQSDSASWLSTHPSGAERIAYLKSAIESRR